ncbi:hypothetical protein ACN42_g11624 [Penicillium freii]|uniref:Uncharacterized protein n=1 Tax=Penicillium freii TaxID=48697 RepID=A0A101M7U4_PENFR|nr:hypothetical protein ACN42_g11624 [Penicillium freii]
MCPSGKFDRSMTTDSWRQTQWPVVFGPTRRVNGLFGIRFIEVSLLARREEGGLGESARMLRPAFVS